MPTQQLNNDDLYARISRRKAQILTAIARRATQKEIAVLLVVAFDTVHTHVEQLKDITGCRSMAQLGNWWEQHRRPWVAYYARAAGIEFEGDQ